MIILLWLVLCVAGIAVFLLIPAIWLREITRRYAGARLVACPKNQQPGVVNLDVRHAAATGMNGSPDLRVCDCTRWPDNRNCGQECLAQAAEAEPYAAGAGKAGRKRIYHLPIVLAAFAAWCLGAIWHAQYLFRTRWMDALGLPHAQVKQMVWWIWPHLLTLAVCLLFAYGVAWLLAVSHRKGVLQGMLMAGVLCGAVAAANAFGLTRLPHDLLAIEAGYAVLATLLMGAVVGGLSDKLVMPRG